VLSSACSQTNENIARKYRKRGQAAGRVHGVPRSHHASRECRSRVAVVDAAEVVVARRCSTARSPRVHGAFTAHLTVNGKQYTQTFNVKPDPRPCVS
jgi:hypothetical protein